jgi:hypothetical protein
VGLSSPKLTLDFSVGRVSRFRTKQSFLSIAFSKLSSRLHLKFNVVSVSAPPESFSIARVVESLVNKIDLSEKEAEAVLDHLLRGGANEVQISVFLVLLRAKGKTYEEITGLAKAMIKCCVHLDGLTDAIDIVGHRFSGSTCMRAHSSFRRFYASAIIERSFSTIKPHQKQQWQDK